MARVDEPLIINGKTIKNRLTMAPTVKFDMAGEDGFVTPEHVRHYSERAAGGFGLICVEATAVTPDGRFAPNHMGLWEDAQTEGHKAITDACHKEGTVVLIQINHTGNTGNPMFGQAKGPSAVEVWNGNHSQAMTVDEIHVMQSNFISAAKRAFDAGYDGVQLHGCHGYLINQFVSPRTNLRTDEYGLDKSLFASEIIRGIREVCGSDFLISVRTPGAEPDIDNALYVAEKYVEAGCDYLQVSHGIDSFGNIVKEDDSYSDLCALGVNFRKAYKGNVPVSCVGGLMTPEQVRHIIEKDLCDTVDLARSALADPGYAGAILNGTPYVKCMECKACQYGPGTGHKCPAAMKRGVI
ncbi:MAG: NADH:flavin oxidoreductase [Lachnospiraceae bacterium]|nr:NADH:flavin oxidoreductase [Lachnospiraceae bacterium]